MSQNIPLGWAPIQPNLKLRKAGKLLRKFSVLLCTVDPWANGSHSFVSLSVRDFERPGVEQEGI